MAASPYSSGKRQREKYQRKASTRGIYRGRQAAKRKKGAVAPIVAAAVGENEAYQ